MKLTSIEKPQAEIISLQEAKNYLRIEHEFDDDLIKDLIITARELIETVTEQSIIKQTWQCTFEYGEICDFYSMDDEKPSIFGWLVTIPLPKSPVTKIISVEVGNEALKGDQYRLENRQNRSYLFIDLIKLAKTKIGDSIKIVYESGLSDKVENIPYQLKLACYMLVANAYQDRYSAEKGNVISQGVRQLLNPFTNFRLA